MDDVFVYSVNLPPTVNELVTPCVDGYTVYLNNRLSRDGMFKAYNHALGHIRNNDFEKVLADEIEKDSHQN